MKKGNPLKKYIAFIKAGLMEGMAFRATYFVVFFSNIVYLVIIYFLWKAIYASSPVDTVCGMTFQDTLIYLVLASSIFSFMETYLVFVMGNDVQTGKIVVDLVKPMDYKALVFWTSSGDLTSGFFLSFLPTFIVVFFLTNGAIKLGVNLPLFFLSAAFAIMINFNINFTVGTVCLYTESNWGVNMVKEVIVLLLSGATVPLAFFPPAFRTVVEALPFQAIYNVPLQILINSELGAKEYLIYFATQIFWVFVTAIISRLFWKKSVKVITVNGG